VAGVGVAMPQNRRDELVCLPVEDEKRMEDTFFVVTVVVGSFLLSMGGICGLSRSLKGGEKEHHPSLALGCRAPQTLELSDSTNGL
jgi:hypothetical protein